MKKRVSYFMMISMISLTLLSCMNRGKKNTEDKPQKAQDMVTDNLKEDTYNPGPEWILDWSDEFKGDTIDETNWSAQVVEAGRFNEEWQRYTNSSNNAYIEDECLVIKAIHEGEVHGIDQYTSARLHTANKRSWKYGKIAARIKLPQGEGIWPAFWMLGTNIDENGGDTPWPQCGEIDILELYGSKDDAAIEANMHYADKSGEHASMGAVTYELEEGVFADAFHVFELEWDANTMRWLVDGKEYASAPISADDASEFHREFFILLNVAVGGTWAGRPDQTTSFPQCMYIDWVRVYKKTEPITE